MPYQVRVSSSIVFFRIGSFTLLTQSQFVTGSRTTSPVSHNPGLVVRPLWANSSLLGSTYGGSRPVTRSVKSVAATRNPTTRKPVFSAFIFVLRTFYDRDFARKPSSQERNMTPPYHFLTSGAGWFGEVARLG